MFQTNKVSLTDTGVCQMFCLLEEKLSEEVILFCFFWLYTEEHGFHQEQTRHKYSDTDRRDASVSPPKEFLLHLAG